MGITKSICVAVKACKMIKIFNCLKTATAVIAFVLVAVSALSMCRH
ncbi:MAG: hypothetical protein IJZ35_06335 [Clostridia bacterium]|nr:hypothetical protein [Clostridia bacterium]